MIDPTKTTRILRNERGQIAVEYVLLLIVGVLIYAMVVKALMSRDPNDPGAIIKKWADIIQFIGGDKIEK